MTNKRLDRKFMSWVWGIVRLFPMFILFVLMASCLCQFTSDFWEFGTDFISASQNGIFELIFSTEGYFDVPFNENIIYYLVPNFFRDFVLNFLAYFELPMSGIFYLLYLSIFYQVWISILQILFNVLMILPNITNYFIEKFNHLGNKGDY